MILAFGIIIAGVFVGQILKKNYAGKQVAMQKKIELYIDNTRKFAFFVLNPIIMINSYWIIDFSDISIFVLPFICVFVLACSGIIGLSVSKALKHNAQQQAAMFAVATFSNPGTIGGHYRNCFKYFAVRSPDFYGSL